jgi:hypothetical protein
MNGRAWNWYAELDEAGQQAMRDRIAATRAVNQAIAQANVKPALWERLEPPPAVARRQRQYDRYHLIHRMHEVAGMTYREIGSQIGMSTAQAQVTHRRGWRYARSPVETWLDGWQKTRGWAAIDAKAREEAYVEDERVKRLLKLQKPKKPKPSYPRRGLRPRQSAIDIAPSEEAPAAFAYWVRVHFVGAWQAYGEDDGGEGK